MSLEYFEGCLDEELEKLLNERILSFKQLETGDVEIEFEKHILTLDFYSSFTVSTKPRTEVK